MRFGSVKRIMKLLIVEDNLDFRKILKELFSEHFKRIYETSSGKEAIQKYKMGRPDWVFMDIGIEELDGISTTKEIIKAFPNAKIVIVSQYNEQKIIDKAKDAGAKDYVVKQDISRLFEIIA